MPRKSCKRAAVVGTHPVPLAAALLLVAAAPVQASFVGSPYDIELNAFLDDGSTLEGHYGSVTFDSVQETVPADPIFAPFAPGNDLTVAEQVTLSDDDGETIEIVTRGAAGQSLFANSLGDSDVTFNLFDLYWTRPAVAAVSDITLTVGYSDGATRDVASTFLTLVGEGTSASPLSFLFGIGPEDFSLDGASATELTLTAAISEDAGGTVNPIPIPAAFTLFPAGLAALGLIGWRGRREPSATRA